MEAKRKSPNELADYLGWSTAEQFGKWRRGSYRISRQNAIRLAAFLGVRLEDLDPSGESFDLENRGPSRRPPKSLDRLAESDTIAPSPTHQERERSEGASMNDDPGPRGDQQREVLAIYEYVRSRTGSEPEVMKALLNDFDALARRRVDEYRGTKEKSAADLAESAKKQHRPA